jgi:hypothetical protein
VRTMPRRSAGAECGGCASGRMGITREDGRAGGLIRKGRGKAADG